MVARLVHRRRVPVVDVVPVAGSKVLLVLMVTWGCFQSEKLIRRVCDVKV